VEVDIEGNITLRGVSSVEIWVNDKPSRLTEENLKTYLETLPANALDRIETITNPSAKYATSAEAVINIITSAYIKSNHFVSFGVNGATQPFVSPWVSYTWANERLSVNLYASGRYNYSNNEGWNKTTYRKDHNTEPDSTYDTVATENYNSESNSRRLSGNIFAHVSYEIDSMTNVEFMGSYNLSNSKSESLYDRARNNFTTSELFHYFDTNSSSSNNGFGMAGIDYTHKFDKKGHNIRASLHGNFSNGNSQNDFILQYTTGTLYTIGENFDKCYLDKYYNNNLDATMRYNRPYSENGELSFGLGYGLKTIARKYNVVDSLTGTGVRDELRSYDFDDTEHSVEGDVEWTRRFGNFTLELGLGAQYEHIDFRYFGSETYPFTIDSLATSFLTYNPSVHLSYRTEDLHNFTLNYDAYAPTERGEYHHLQALFGGQLLDRQPRHHLLLHPQCRGGLEQVFHEFWKHRAGGVCPSEHQRDKQPYLVDRRGGPDTGPHCAVYGAVQHGVVLPRGRHGVCHLPPVGICQCASLHQYL